MKVVTLRARWDALLCPLTVDSAGALALYDELVARYSGDGRFYHNLDHLQQVLDMAAALQYLSHDFTAVQLAAWFHDVVYDPRAADNEAQSAAYAGHALTHLSVPAEIVTSVQQMVLATKTHDTAVGDIDTQILLDADLAILGSEPEVYAGYAQAIRHEYAWVPQQAYQEGRQRVLESFRQRQHIYHTAPMRAAFETQARRNISREISTGD